MIIVIFYEKIVSNIKDLNLNFFIILQLMKKIEINLRQKILVANIFFGKIQ